MGDEPGVAYAYDDDGLLLQAGEMVYTRDVDNGFVVAAALGGVTTSYSYNGFGELTAQHTALGGPTLYAASYTRDALGRLTTQTQTLDGATSTDAYAYDLAGRLT